MFNYKKKNLIIMTKLPSHFLKKHLFLKKNSNRQPWLAASRLDQIWPRAETKSSLGMVESSLPRPDLVAAAYFVTLSLLARVFFQFLQIGCAVGQALSDLEYLAIGQIQHFLSNGQIGFVNFKFISLISYPKILKLQEQKVDVLNFLMQEES